MKSWSSSKKKINVGWAWGTNFLLYINFILNTFSMKKLAFLILGFFSNFFLYFSWRVLRISQYCFLYSASCCFSSGSSSSNQLLKYRTMCSELMFWVKNLSSRYTRWWYIKFNGLLSMSSLQPFWSKFNDNYRLLLFFGIWSRTTFIAYVF